MSTPAVPAAGDVPAPDAVDAVLDALPDGLVVIGPDGTVTRVNPAAARLLGVPVDDLVGRPLAEALPLQDADGRDWWACARPFDGLSTRTRQPERLLQLPDGRHLLVTAGYQRGDDRRLSRLVVALRDTRSRDRAERQRAELVSIMSHDLRSPLASIKGFTATLLRAWDRFADEQKRQMLETVLVDADRMARLIGDLLDVSRIDTGRLEIRRQQVDVADLARRTVEARVASGADDRRFHVDAPERPVPVWADPDRLAQVLTNLLENAVRHGAGRVTVRVAPHGDGALLSVADEGEGVPVGARRRAFLNFWRCGTGRGTGLGLYIVKGVVDAHGGAVEIGGADTGGALVTVTLPAGTPSFV